MKLTLLLSTAALTLSLASCAATAGPSGQLEVRAVSPTTATLTRTVELSGVLTPEKTATIYGKLSGQASKILVDVGSRVKTNDILLEIDAHELGAQLALAEAAVATVKQQASQAKVGVDTAQTNYDQAKRYLDRLNALEDRSALSKNQLDDATSKVELTQRALESAKLQYKTTSESGLGQAQAQVDVVRSQIENSILRTPIDGVVTNRNINPGELTNPALALFSVAKIDHLKLQGTVGQDVVSLLQEGRDVSVQVDGMAGDPLKGTVTQIGPVGATSGQYFPVVVTIAQPGKALAGMTARVILDVTGTPSLVVPATALKTDQGRSWVYVVRDGKAVQTTVSTGISDGRSVQVLRGLNAGDVVVTTNVSLLSDGMPVLVRKAGEQS